METSELSDADSDRYTAATPNSADVSTFHTSGTLRASDRWDVRWLMVRANQLIRNTPIQRVTMAPGGGTLDLHFVVQDRRAAYEAAAPVIRTLLGEFSLLMDFHFVSPEEIAE
jgi:hypothetical protein